MLHNFKSGWREMLLKIAAYVVQIFISYVFLKYFSFVSRADEVGTATLGVKEIMEIFLATSFVLMVASGLLKIALRKMFGLGLAVTPKSKIILFFVAITLAYALASLIVALNEMDKSFYFVFVVFYIINLVSAVGYFLLGALYSTFYGEFFRV